MDLQAIMWQTFACDERACMEFDPALFVSSFQPGNAKAEFRAQVPPPLPKRLKAREFMTPGSRDPTLTSAPAVPSVHRLPDGNRSSFAPRCTDRIALLAHCVACGRIVQALQLLSATPLANLDDTLELPIRGAPLVPRRGLQATMGNKPVYILDTFARSGGMSRYISTSLTLCSTLFI